MKSRYKEKQDMTGKMENRKVIREKKNQEKDDRRQKRKEHKEGGRASKIGGIK